jgi:hypothetical protein
MPELEYFLVAESISIDRDRNQVSVFNILEEIAVPRSNPVIPQAVAIGSWILKPEDQNQEFHVGLTIAKPDGRHRSGPFFVNFTAKGNRQRVHLNIVGFPIESDGDITFDLSLNDEHQATHTLAVRWSENE